MAETKKCNKKALIAVGILVVVLTAMAAVFFIFRPKPAEGSKSITIEVINSAQESKMYELKTDAEYLRQAMEEAKGLEFSGTESEEFGLTLITVNGEDTDFNNGSYWGIFVMVNMVCTVLIPSRFMTGMHFRLFTLFIRQRKV